MAAFYYQQATRIGYSRGGPKDKEVDIAVDYPNIKKILIEVKYREQAPIPNDDEIIIELEFCGKYRCKASRKQLLEGDERA